MLGKVTMLLKKEVESEKEVEDREESKKITKLKTLTSHFQLL